MMRSRFQRGWLVKKKRSSGDVWVYRFREYGPDGPVQRSLVIGPVSKYPNESDANRQVELKRLEINRDYAQSTPGPLMTISMLVSHYREHRIESEDYDDDNSLASATRDAYDSYLKNYILPKWGELLLPELRTIAVQDWLKKLNKPNGNPMARGTKAKIRNIMHSLFEHAIRYEFTERNPIAQVRQSAKREHIPEILTVAELRSLLDELTQRDRTMVLVDAGSGLRRGELFALKWNDIDFESKQANVTRSIIHNTRRNREGRCKTEASRKPVPLDDLMLEELSLWRLETAYPEPENWVFASPTKEGKQPLWPQMVMRDHIQPAAVRAGIRKQIGWHTFRHSYTSLLKANGEDIKVVQELLRHANSRTTMDVYAQALTPQKRAAQSRVTQMILRREA